MNVQVGQAAGEEVLLVDGDILALRATTALLEGAGLTVTAVSDAGRARDQLTNRFFAVAVIDLDTPSAGDGVELVKFVRKEAPLTAPIVVTARTDFTAVAEAFRAGAADVVPKADDGIAYLRNRTVAAAAEVRATASREDLLVQVGEIHEDFLKQLMDLSRQVTDLEDKLLSREGSTSSSLTALGIVNVLVVDDEEGLAAILERELLADKGWRIRYAQSGGEALDSASQTTPHVVVVKELLPDLPGSMVIKSVRAAAPDLVSLVFNPPAEFGDGDVRMVDGSRLVTLIPAFTDPAQLVGALNDVRLTLVKKAKEKRYLHIFRKQHFEFLKRYAAVKRRLDSKSPS